MNEPFEYVCQMYGVPACAGRLVTVNGRAGVIAEDRGHHIGVLFDDMEPGNVLPAHPTWEVVYGEMGTIRKPPRLSRKKQEAKERYAEYKESAECWPSFAAFLGIERRRG